MVYRGPSTGCKRCRQRHIKCDELRPSCRRCNAIGESCPGYRGVDGVVFKDVTKSVIERQARKSNATRAFCRTTSPPVGLLPQIVPSRANLSIDFFFLNYVLTAERDRTTSLGHFDYIIPLYQGCTPLSVLDLSVSLISTCSLCSHLGQEPDARWYLQTEQAACQALQTAIADPHESMLNETLLAVLCLNFADQLYSKTHGKPPSRTHIGGAIALAHHRGPTGFDDDVSQSLLAATRASTVRQSLWFNDDRSQDAVLSLPAIAPTEANPAVTLHYILSQVLVLERLCKKEQQDASTEARPANLKSLNDMAHRCMRDTERWLSAANKLWQISSCFRQANEPPKESSDSSSKVLPSVRIAYILGQWCCLKLMVLKYMAITTDDGMPSCDTLSDADQVLQGLCVVLTYLFEAENGCKKIPTVVQGESTNNAIIASPALRPDYKYGAYDGLHCSFNLLRWIEDVLAEDQFGTTVIRCTDQTLNQLSDLSTQARSMTPANIGYYTDL